MAGPAWQVLPPAFQELWWGWQEEAEERAGEGGDA